MRTPSTGDFRPPDEKGSEPAGDHPPGRSQTKASVAGQPSPRLPHERDESSDSAGQIPDKIDRTAYADAVSNKVPTDRSEEANAAYEGLRDSDPKQDPEVAPIDRHAAR